MLERYRTMGAMLALGEFSVDELAALSGVKKTTVSTTLRRADDYIERIGTAQSGRRGGQPVRWRLRPGARDRLREELRELERLGAGPWIAGLEDSAGGGLSEGEIAAALIEAEHVLLDLVPEASNANERAQLVALAQAQFEAAELTPTSSPAHPRRERENCHRRLIQLLLDFEKAGQSSTNSDSQTSARLNELICDLLLAAGRIDERRLSDAVKARVRSMLATSTLGRPDGPASQETLAPDPADPTTGPDSSVSVQPSAVPATRSTEAGSDTSPARVPLAGTGSGDDFLRRMAIGIKITSDSSANNYLVGVVTDMLANVEADPITVSLERTDEKYVLAQIMNLIDELRPLIGEDRELVGVGLELGGHVHKGRVIYSPNARWNQFPLAGRLQSIRGIPVVLENDANALAIYERRFTGIEDHTFAVIVLTEVGVGCGLMLDGRIHHGVRGMAGEIGHMPLTVGDPNEEATCRCLNPGCLECAATPHAIERSLREERFDGNYQKAVRSIDTERVRKAFERAGASLGRAIISVINLINPSAIVFYGREELLGPPRTFYISEKQTTHVDDDLPAAGAARIYTESMIGAIRRNAFSTGVYEDCRFKVRTSADLYSARAAAACLIDQAILAPLELVSRA